MIATPAERGRTALLLAVLAGMLVGCEASPDIQEKNSVDKSISRNADAANGYLADTTLATWDRQHGTQIEYLGADGRTALWYPGNSGPVMGQWEIRDKGRGDAEICFRYGADTFNPVTGQSGGDWECQDVYYYTAWKFERVAGDPFNLTSGRLPFILPTREHVILSDAANRAGVGDAELRWKQGAVRLLKE